MVGQGLFHHPSRGGDLDGNGISDDQEGGVVQAQVTRSLSSPTVTYEPTDLVVESEETVAEIEQMVLIDPNDLEIDETTPDRLPSAMLAYKLVLHRPGQRALVTINLSDPAPAGATWIKYDAVNGWQDYSHHATISADRRSVTVEVKDGGYGDADGVANGIIVDPAGLSIAPIAPAAGGRWRWRRRWLLHYGHPKRKRAGPGPLAVGPFKDASLSDHHRQITAGYPT